MGGLFIVLLIVGITLDIFFDRLFLNIGCWTVSLFSNQSVAGVQGGFPEWLYRLAGFVVWVLALAAARFLTGMFGG